MTYFSRKNAMRERTRMVMRFVLEETTNSSKTPNIPRKISFSFFFCFFVFALNESAYSDHQ